MSEDSEKNGGARTAIILLALVILVAGYTIEFGLQTLTWIEAKLWSSDNSWLTVVPQPLPPAVTPPPPVVPVTPPAKTSARAAAAAAAAAKASELKAFNFEFNSPWPGTPKTAGSLTYSQFMYDSGQVIVFFDPDSLLDTLQTLKTSNPVEYQKFINVFSDKPVDSNFGLYEAVYGAAPAQVSPFIATPDALRMNVLLLWKLSFGPDLKADGEFYSFDWGKIRGFQFGNPEKLRPVALRLFDDRSHQFRFILTVKGGSTAQISQADINTIVQSLQPEPFIER
jgi:hypothetical protein